jgi:hypothetical protein
MALLAYADALFCSIWTIHKVRQTLVIERSAQLTRFFLRIVLTLTATGIAGMTYPASANQCKPGFVWREASSSDLMCVVPQQRDQAAEDNAAAASRIAPCRPGFVPRSAVRGDNVCVTPAARDLAASENDLNLRRTNLLCEQTSTDPSRCPRPARCKQGFVHRQATTKDYACVPQQARSRVSQENAAGPKNKGGNTCSAGYVWRGAFPGDSVCVTPEVRRQVLADNADQANRVVSGSPPPPGQPTSPPSESCSISVTIRNRSCLNADGSPSTILEPGTTSASGCGGNRENARLRAKLNFQQFSCLTEGDQPSPGCCTYSEEVVQGCLCR